jgi:hypothetical protein
MHCDVQQVRELFPRLEYLGAMRRIVSGLTVKSGTRIPYPDERFEQVWTALSQLNRNPELTAAIQNRDVSEETGLARKIFGAPAMTLTGRIRGRVSFAAARNTPFQGLAADGAKLAMYDLLRAGYTVSAFIHDEFLIQLPDEETDWTTEPHRIADIVCSAMQRVCGTIPIQAEYARTKRWYKGAEAVHDPKTGELLCWEPEDESDSRHVVQVLPEHSARAVAQLKSDETATGCQALE